MPTEEENTAQRIIIFALMKDELITVNWEHLINHLMLVLCMLTFH